MLSGLSFVLVGESLPASEGSAGSGEAGAARWRGVTDGTHLACCESGRRLASALNGITSASPVSAEREGLGGDGELSPSFR